MNRINTKTVSLDGRHGSITLPFNSNIIGYGMVDSLLDEEDKLTVSYIYSDTEERTEEKKFVVFNDGDNIDLPAILHTKSICHNEKMYHVFGLIYGEQDGKTRD
jgi:hypothetical protein